ncbi:hypothetical protein [Amycolatopsis dongchuanensis]|uniref:hypothetical protein n=1 Tax=Amycolatopsis dongchuanensis TaxID=1070866 RepID=UPI0031FA1D7B
MLSTTRRLIAVSLVEYGEEPIADWASSCADDDFLRICGAADWLLHEGPKTASGASMTFAKAIALAAVFVREQKPRPLARSRRKREEKPFAGGDPKLDERPDFWKQLELGDHYGVAGTFSAYWKNAD